MQQVIQGDCLQVMKEMPENSIDAIITDPPYGLKFMSKKWDYQVPSVECWQETLRILKPGGYALIFGGSRTYHRMAVNVEDAGYHIVDCIMWLHGQGFPKGKSQLKPAYEPIILARKKADKVLPLQIDECRIGTEGTKRSHQAEYPKNEDGSEDRSKHWARNGHSVIKTGLGRYPANIILDEVAAEMLDEQSGILKSGNPGIRRIPHKTHSMLGSLRMTGNMESGIGDSGGASRFFFCAKASPSERNAGLEGFPMKDANKIGKFNEPGKNGSLKNSKPMFNHHPTVKPLKLMEYLIKLVMPTDPGATLLDPFCGSGTMLLAAKRLGRKAIGIELEKEYCDIANARLQNCEVPQEQYQLFN